MDHKENATLAQEKEEYKLHVTKSKLRVICLTVFLYWYALKEIRVCPSSKMSIQNLYNNRL